MRIDRQTCETYITRLTMQRPDLGIYPHTDILNATP